MNRQVPKALLISAAALSLLGSLIAIISWIDIFVEYPGFWNEASYISRASLSFSFFSIAFNVLIMLAALTSIILNIQRVLNRLLLIFIFFNLASYPIYLALFVLEDQSFTFTRILDFFTLQILGFMFSYSSFPYLNLNSFVVITGHIVLVVFIYFLYSSRKSQAAPMGIFTQTSVETAPISSGNASSSFLDDIERLEKLYSAGTLTKTEFTAAKKRVLGG